MEGPHLEESAHLFVYMHVCSTFYPSVVSLVMFADKRLQLLAMIIKHDELALGLSIGC